VWEVEINAPDLIFVRRHRGVSGYHEEVFHDDDHVLRTLTKILRRGEGPGLVAGRRTVRECVVRGERS
jgi:pilus assembly protein CpaF